MANTRFNDNDTLSAQPVSSTMMPSMLGGNQIPSFGISLTQIPPMKLIVEIPR